MSKINFFRKLQIWVNEMMSKRPYTVKGKTQRKDSTND